MQGWNRLNRQIIFIFHIQTDAFIVSVLPFLGSKSLTRFHKLVALWHWQTKPDHQREREREREMESPFKAEVLKGKVALITGGGSGIGFEISTQFGKHGASIAIMGRRKEVLDLAVSALHSQGIQVLFYFLIKIFFFFKIFIWVLLVLCFFLVGLFVCWKNRSYEEKDWFLTLTPYWVGIQVHFGSFCMFIGYIGSVWLIRKVSKGKGKWVFCSFC